MMKHFTACMLSFLSIAGSIKAQNYSNNAQQSSRINALATAHSQYVKVKSIAKTAGGNDVWQITIGTGNTKPNLPLQSLAGSKEIICLEQSWPLALQKIFCRESIQTA